MKLTGASSGEIKGGSDDAGFEDQIELEDWNWTLGKSSGEEKTVEPSTFTFSKLLDPATTAMLSAMCSGEELKAVISLEESSESEFELVVTLEKVRVVNYSLNARSEKDSGEISEDWAFSYTTIHFDYKPSAKEGKLSARLSRAATASHAAPARIQEQILERAGELEPHELRELARRIEDLINMPAGERSRAGGPKAPLNKQMPQKPGALRQPGNNTHH